MRTVALALICGTGCAGDGVDKGEDTAAVDCTLTGILDADSVAAALVGDAATFAEVSATVTSAAEISIRATASGAPTVPGPDASTQDGAFTLPLRGLRVDTEYTVHVRADTADGCEVATATLATGPLAGEPPNLGLVLDDDAYDAGYVAAMYQTTGDAGSGVAMYDVDGGIVWSWVTDNSPGTVQFFEPTPDGRGLFLLYADSVTPERAHVRYVGWDGVEYDDYPIEAAHHSATQKVPGIAFAALVHVERDIPGFGETCGSGDDHVIGDAIVEVGYDGAVTEVWNAFDDRPIECHDWLAFGSEVNDWSHLNSLDYDPDRDLWLVSEYWFGQVRFIDRATRETVFTLGSATGADCYDDLSRQHAAKFTPDGISLYDNGHDPARMVRYALDIDSGDCRVAEEFEHPDGITALTLGDLDVEDDGRWFTAWGDGGDLLVIDEGELETKGDATALWHATVPADYEDEHGGTILGGISFLPSLYDIDFAR